MRRASHLVSVRYRRSRLEDDVHLARGEPRRRYPGPGSARRREKAVTSAPAQGQRAGR